VEKLKADERYRRGYRPGEAVAVVTDDGLGSFQVRRGWVDERASTSTTASSTPPLPRDKFEAKVAHYRQEIVSQFRNAVAETGRSVRNGDVRNAYRVPAPVDAAEEEAVKRRRNLTKKKKGILAVALPPTAAGVGPRTDAHVKVEESAEELVCLASKDVNLTFFNSGNPFFREQHLDQFFLLHHPMTSGAPFDSCGVVSSSGSLWGSKLGEDIDSNDVVIRFNDAPTSGYERDVGERTTLRIVNSQVVGKPEFQFLERAGKGAFASDATLVWDPAAYNATLKEWYSSPDYPFFETFFSRRLMSPQEELHLLHPASVWSAWDWLQKHTRHPLLPNPPSSGFLGILLALRRCRRVRVYEFVPSMRLTKKCHYYGEEENLGCTIGDWHPLAAEKLLALAMNEADDLTVFSKGYLQIKGQPDIKGGCRKRLKKTDS